MRPSPWREKYNAMTRDERLNLYDQHNRHARTSNDLNLRLHGVCGCEFCAETRKEWSQNPAPINDPRRKGSRAMGSINVCDISGDFVNGEALGSVTLVTSGNTRESETIHKEICPACVAALVRILETGTDQHSKRAHTKGWKRPKVEDDTAEESVRSIIRKVVEETHRAQKEIAGRTTEVDPEDNVV